MSKGKSTQHRLTKERYIELSSADGDTTTISDQYGLLTITKRVVKGWEVSLLYSTTVSEEERYSLIIPRGPGAEKARKALGISSASL